MVAGRTKLRLDNGVDAPLTGWREVLDWDRSGAHDRDFRVAPERGELQSGDGLRAAVLPAGYSLHVKYQEGCGEAGNIAAGTLDKVPPNAANTLLAPAIAAFAKPLAVWQPFAAIGGTVRETLGSVQARAFESATRVDKAVTTADFERLALATPGVPVARAHAVPGLHPALPCYSAPGAVTLIVVPYCPLPCAASEPGAARRRCALPEPAASGDERDPCGGARVPPYHRARDASPRRRRRAAESCASAPSPR